MTALPACLFLTQSIREVLKFTSPADLLRFGALVSAQWCTAASSDDVWIAYLHTARFPTCSYGLSKKWQYRRSVRQSQLIPVFCYSSFRVFDCRTETWRRYEKAPALKECIDVVCVFAGDGSVICTGGRLLQGDWGSRNVLQVTSTAVTTLAQMRCPRIRHAAVVVSNVLYTFGGESRCEVGECGEEAVQCYSRVLWRTAERLSLDDPKRELWTAVPCMPIAKTRVSACSRGREIFVCGWQAELSIDVFDTKSLAYRSLALQMPFAFQMMGSFVVMNAGQLTLFVPKKPTEADGADIKFAVIPDEVQDCILGLSTGRVVRSRVYVELFGGAICSLAALSPQCKIHPLK